MSIQAEIVLLDAKGVRLTRARSATLEALAALDSADVGVPALQTAEQALGRELLKVAGRRGELLRREARQ